MYIKDINLLFCISRLMLIINHIKFTLQTKNVLNNIKAEAVSTLFSSLVTMDSH